LRQDDYWRWALKVYLVIIQSKMSDLIYNISKEAASQLLGISTRTIDRYLAQGKLTSKKTGNKVMLAQDEVLLLKKEGDDIEINDIDIIS